MKAYSPDYTFAIILGLLVFGGLVVLASASSVLGAEKFGDPNYYLKHQITGGLAVGLVGFFVFSWLDYRLLRKVSFVLLFLTMLGLVLVFVPGIGLKISGASRWIRIGGFSFQPAEFAKLSFIIYLAAWLSSSRRSVSDWRRVLIPFLLLSGIVGGLIAVEPATGTMVILMAATLIVLFLARVPLWQIGFIILLGIVGILILVQISPYRFERIISFLQPELDPQGKGYQGRQAAIAIASGGLFGLGLGNSRQKYLYLPEPIGDSIFAILVEELGLIGGAVFIGLFLALGMRGFRIGRNAHDEFGHLLVSGIISIVLIQAFVNMAAISGLGPLTGVPLPFISYGGSALATLLSAMGMVMSVSRYTK